jgi:hypothetical protein
VKSYYWIPAETVGWATHREALAHRPADAKLVADSADGGFAIADYDTIAPIDLGRWRALYRHAGWRSRVSSDGKLLEVEIPGCCWLVTTDDADERLGLPPPATLMSRRNSYVHLAVRGEVRARDLPGGVSVELWAPAPPTPDTVWVERSQCRWDSQPIVKAADLPDEWRQVALLDAVRGVLATEPHAAVVTIARRIGRRRADVAEVVRQLKGSD